ncbi:efflux RND transporter periplasmic adaptor subunit [Pluralibacter gergoviae]|nr:efflux RND transporter periplasmic adaptor subunit [Pluralibacter gergoviae]EMD1656563.1 efflux RND transporter periplasmic adaptor subunit [Pluralibacter gergoviae]
MRQKILPLLIIATLATGCDNSGSSAEKPSAPPEVAGVITHTEPVTLSSMLPGRTVSMRTAEVRPQVDGILQKRLFREGAEVKAGDQLYQIDPSTYQAAVDKAQAAWRNATALAQRYRQLVGVQAISKQDYDDAVTAAEETRAALATARINLDYTRVRAPITGRIDRSLITEGALVTNGQQNYLTTITQLDPIYVDITESSRNLLRLRHQIASGQLRTLNSHEAPIRLMLEDGTPYQLEGRLDFSEVRVDQSTGSVTLRATFPNPDRTLLPGMFVHADLAQGVQEKTILVPQASVIHDNKGHPFVWVVDKDSVVKQRQIETGEMQDGQWQVISGLTTGEKVISNGLQRISEGSKVKWVEQKETAKAKNDISLTIADPSTQ